MLTKQTFERLNALADIIDDWANNNFEVHLPELGMLEEIGELTHCILKRAQRIRGFEDFTFFQSQTKDAIGDIMVYMLHDLKRANENLVWDEEKFGIKASEGWSTDTGMENLEKILGELGECAGCHLQGLLYWGYWNPREAILLLLDHLCVCYGWNLLEILEHTWAEVCKRNWKVNPIKGV